MVNQPNANKTTADNCADHCGKSQREWLSIFINLTLARTVRGGEEEAIEGRGSANHEHHSKDAGAFTRDQLPVSDSLNIFPLK